MPLGTDLSRLLTKEEPATPQEAEVIRMELNRIQQQNSMIAKILDSKGNLDANIFSHMSGKFSQLPHEAASMIKSSGSTVQTINSSTTTAIIPTADASLDADELRLSYSHGIRRNISTGEFLLEGVTEDQIWLFVAELQWSTIPDTYYFYAMEKDTASGYELGHETSSSDAVGKMVGSVMMRARKAASSWQLTVYQSTAGAATKDVDWSAFQIVRLR